MTKHFKYSKGLHWATLCCFLFPFFYTGCGPSAGEKAAKEKATQDSSALYQTVIAPETNNADTAQQEGALTKSVDTIVEKTISQIDPSKEPVPSLHPETTASEPEKESKNPSEKISNKFPFLKPFLIPKSDTYTGIATVIDTISFITFLAVFISFFFLIISLAIKFIEVSAKKTIAFLDILALIFLFISQPFSLGGDNEKLWGFWVALTFVFSLTIYDLYLIKLNRHLIDDPGKKLAT